MGVPTLSLWVVRIKGRRRAHMVAQIVRGIEVFWSSSTTVCGLRGWENYGEGRMQFCRRCTEACMDRWEGAPPDLLESILQRGRDKSR